MRIHEGGNPGRLHSRGDNGADLKDERQFASQKNRAGRKRKLGRMRERTISSKIQGQQEDGPSEGLYKY